MEEGAATPTPSRRSYLLQLALGAVLGVLVVAVVAWVLQPTKHVVLRKGVIAPVRVVGVAADGTAYDPSLVTISVVSVETLRPSRLARWWLLLSSDAEDGRQLVEEPAAGMQIQLGLAQPRGVDRRAGESESVPPPGSAPPVGFTFDLDMLVSIAAANTFLDAEAASPRQLEMSTTPITGGSTTLGKSLALIEVERGRSFPSGMKHVVATGQVESSGAVGKIDGVRQKVRTCIAGNVDLLLVPTGNLEEALRVTEDKLEVRGVSSVAEAAALLDRYHGPVTRVGGGLP